jgi:hypothetical protein
MRRGLEQLSAEPEQILEKQEKRYMLGHDYRETLNNILVFILGSPHVPFYHTM